MITLARYEALLANGNVRFVKTYDDIRDLSVIEKIAEFVVPKELANKIWAISEIIYGDVNRVEDLLHFNRLKPFDIKTGTIINIPNLATWPVNVKTKSKKSNASAQTVTTNNPNKKSSNTSIAIKGNGRLVFSSKTTK